MSLKEIMTDPRVTVWVASMTTGAGAAIDFIPDSIGKLATLVGVILSVILIRVYSMTLKKIKLEMEIISRKENERLEKADFLKKQNPLRRRLDD